MGYGRLMLPRFGEPRRTRGAAGSVHRAPCSWRVELSSTVIDQCASVVLVGTTNLLRIRVQIRFEHANLCMHAPWAGNGT
jgi:hypothetical protein